MGAVKFNPVTRGYAVTLAPAGKYPIIGDRIFDTLQDAQDYVDGKAASKTAIPGIILSVISDGDNNGAYWVSQAAGYDGATVGILDKMGEGGGGGEVGDVYFSEILDLPTTLAGYGITDAVQKNSDGSVTLGSSINATAYYCRGYLVLSAGASNNRTLINYGTGRDLLLFGNNIMIKAESAYVPADESTTTIRFGVTTRIDGNLSLAKALRLCDSSGSDMSVMQMTSQNCLYIGQQSAQSDYDTYIFGHNLHFKVNSGASEQLTIRADGSVGINSTTPYSPLDGYTAPIRLGASARVDGSIYLPNYGQIKISNKAATKDLIIFQLNDANNFLLAQKTAAEGYDTWIYGHNLHFKVNKGASELLTILSGGNVGIGAESPQYKLHVAGTGYFAGDVTMTRNLAVNIALSVGSSSGSTINLVRPSANYIWANQAGGYFSFGVQDAGASSNANASLSIWANDVTPGTRDNAVALGRSGYRWKNLFSVLGTFSTSIKIGDATISWDSSAGMLKIDKGVYSTGAITAGK